MIEAKKPYTVAELRKLNDIPLVELLRYVDNEDIQHKCYIFRLGIEPYQLSSYPDSIHIRLSEVLNDRKTTMFRHSVVFNLDDLEHEVEGLIETLKFSQALRTFE